VNRARERTLSQDCGLSEQRVHEVRFQVQRIAPCMFDDDVLRHGDVYGTRYAEFCKAFATSVFDVIVRHSLS
jgi:hypothetical protein